VPKNSVQSAEYGDDVMRKQMQGIALILTSIMLILGFHSAEIEYVFDFRVRWSTVFMVLGTAGLVMTFTKESE